MSEQSRVRVVKTEILSDSWARLEAAHFDYLNSGGQWERQVREVYNRGHGAAILLYNLTARSVILIRQFRYPVFTEDGDGFMIEVPAGVIDNGNPEQTVKAETEQETGYRIGSVQSLFKAYVSPGSVTECLHYYCAPYSASDKIGDGGGLMPRERILKSWKLTLLLQCRGWSQVKLTMPKRFFCCNMLLCICLGKDLNEVCPS